MGLSGSVHGASKRTRLIRHPLICLLMFICCGFFFAPTAVAQSKVQLELQGVWGGAVRAIDPHGDIVYIGSGRRLVALHVEDTPKGAVNLIELGVVDLGSVVNDVKVRDGYAYVVVDGAPNFYIVDVANPSRMNIAWQGSSTFFFDSNEVELYGDHALIRRGSNIRFVYIKNPESPIVQGTGLGGIQFTASEIVGDKLYGVISNPSNPAEFRIYNISLSTTTIPFPILTLAGSIPLAGEAYELGRMAIQGDFAYLTTRNFGGSNGRWRLST